MLSHSNGPICISDAFSCRALCSLTKQSIHSMLEVREHLGKPMGEGPGMMKGENQDFKMKRCKISKKKSSFKTSKFSHFKI
jgi:hypothetical protein